MKIFQGCTHLRIWLQAILFSHPGDFTPVCTTELGEVARRAKDFAARNVKLIGISANGLKDHHKWVEDINEFGAKTGPTDVQYPIVRIATHHWPQILKC
jgi:glutaredoxin/glutathione-dependent peroxiredoxin